MLKQTLIKNPNPKEKLPESIGSKSNETNKSNVSQLLVLKSEICNNQRKQPVVKS
jgi:hypothetical protein